jgi:hypothetical protein
MLLNRLLTIAGLCWLFLIAEWLWAVAGEATLGKGDLYAKGESLYVENYAY